MQSSNIKAIIDAASQGEQKEAYVYARRTANNKIILTTECPPDEIDPLVDFTLFDPKILKTYFELIGFAKQHYPQKSDIAIKLLEEGVIAQYPRYPDGYMELADIRNKRGEHVLAIELYSQIIALCPKHTKALLLRAGLQKNVNNEYKKSFPDDITNLPYDPKIIEADIKLVMELRESEKKFTLSYHAKLRRIISHLYVKPYSTAKLLVPNNGDRFDDSDVALSNSAVIAAFMGTSCTQDDNTELAEYYFQKAILLFNHDMFSMAEIAFIYAKRGDTQRALNELSTCADRYDYSKAYFYCGVIQQALENVSLAKANYIATALLSDHYDIDDGCYGDKLQEMIFLINDINITEYQAPPERPKDETIAIYQKINIISTQITERTYRGNIDEDIRLIKTEIQRDPFIYFIYTALGFLQVKQDNIQEALVNFSLALILAPPHQRFEQYWARCIASIAKGNVVTAEQNLDRALVTMNETDPTEKFTITLNLMKQYAKRCEIDGDHFLVTANYPTSTRLYNSGLKQFKTAELYIKLATSLMLQERYDEALTCIEPAYLFAINRPDQHREIARIEKQCTTKANALSYKRALAQKAAAKAQLLSSPKNDNKVVLSEVKEAEEPTPKKGNNKPKIVFGTTTSHIKSKLQQAEKKADPTPEEIEKAKEEQAKEEARLEKLRLQENEIALFLQEQEEQTHLLKIEKEERRRERKKLKEKARKERLRANRNSNTTAKVKQPVEDENESESKNDADDNNSSASSSSSQTDNSPAQFSIPDRILIEPTVHEKTVFKIFENYNDKMAACELVVMPSLPQEGAFKDYGIQSNAAYIRCEDKLFYVNKLNKECLPLTNVKLNEFDSQLQPSETARILSLDEISKISWLAKHAHKRPKPYLFYSAGGDVFDRVRKMLFGHPHENILDHDILVEIPSNHLYELFPQDVFPRFGASAVFDGLFILEIDTIAGRVKIDIQYKKDLSNLPKDALSKDFIAYYMNSKGEAIDASGFNILMMKTNTLRSIPLVSSVFKDDPIRILRAIYTSTKRKLSIPSDLKQQIKLIKPLLSCEPPHRVNSHMFKLFSQGKASKNYELLMEYEIINTLFPDIAEDLQKDNYWIMNQMRKTNLKESPSLEIIYATFIISAVMTRISALLPTALATLLRDYRRQYDAINLNTSKESEEAFIQHHETSLILAECNKIMDDSPLFSVTIAKSRKKREILATAVSIWKNSKHTPPKVGNSNEVNTEEVVVYQAPRMGSVS